MLKAKSSRNSGELLARKGLVILQFSLSIAFIIAVMVVYEQIQLVKTKNMGFNREQVIQFGREGNLGKGLETFLAALSQIQGVVHASGISGGFLDVNSFTVGVEWPGKQANETLTFSNLTGTYDLIETLDLKMAEGRSFSRSFGADSAGLVLNETAIQAMHLKNPIGQTIKLWGDDYQILGVVKDFHLQSIRAPIKPAFFKINPELSTSIMARLEAGKERETIQRIQAFYSSFNPGYTFEYHFLNEDFEQQYATEYRVSALSKYFAGLAILLSCLGLFGLATFTAEQRTKEIGVRKVLGASVGSLVALLSIDFLKLVVLAIIIACPIAYYFMQQWLSDFAYRVELHWGIFVLAGLVGNGIAFLTVGFQSIRAARMNPVESLRSE